MNRRGYSIIEVMVAASLTLVLMGVVWGAMTVLRKTTLSVQASEEPRKQLRVALQNMQADLRSAAYLFPPGTYDIDGEDRVIADPGVPGTMLAVAIPETSEPPMLYTVVVIYADSRPKTDHRNPDAQSLFYYRVGGIDPPLSDLPGEIDLEALPDNGSRKVFDTYLRSGNGFQVETTDNQHSVSLKFHIRRQEAKGEVQASSYQTTLALRNTI